MTLTLSCDHRVVYGADGALKSSQVLPQDVAGMAFAGGKLVVALADGRLLALAVK